jgi:hypothetical protein
MKRMISALALSALCSGSFAANTATVTKTTQATPGIIWVAITPYPNGDYTKGYAQISVYINGSKVISSYSMSKNNATAPFLIGLPYYGSTAVPISVVSENTSMFFSGTAASIIGVSQGSQPYYTSPTLLLCGKSFTAC